MPLPWPSEGREGLRADLAELFVLGRRAPAFADGAEDLALRVNQQDAAPYGGIARVPEPGDVAAIVAESHVEQLVLDRLGVLPPLRRGVGLVDGHARVERTRPVHAGEIDEFAATIDDR